MILLHCSGLHATKYYQQEHSDITIYHHISQVTRNMVQKQYYIIKQKCTIYLFFTSYYLWQSTN